MACNANSSIKCTVTQCKNHAQTGEYCALNSITIGTHEKNPTQYECTDCMSFELK